MSSYLHVMLIFTHFPLPRKGAWGREPGLGSILCHVHIGDGCSYSVGRRVNMNPIPILRNRNRAFLGHVTLTRADNLSSRRLVAKLPLVTPFALHVAPPFLRPRLKNCPHPIGRHQKRKGPSLHVARIAHRFLSIAPRFGLVTVLEGSCYAGYVFDQDSFVRFVIPLLSI